MSRRTRARLASAKGGVVIRHPVAVGEWCGQRLDNAPGAGRIASACGGSGRKQGLLEGSRRRLTPGTGHCEAGNVGGRRTVRAVSRDSSVIAGTFGLETAGKRSRRGKRSGLRGLPVLWRIGCFGCLRFGRSILGMGSCFGKRRRGGGGFPGLQGRNGQERELKDHDTDRTTGS